MLYHLYLRKGTVFVPAVGKVEGGGAYRDIEPVEVVPAADTEGLRKALKVAMARGNPPIGRYPRLAHPRGNYPPPVVLNYAGLKSWYAFARGTVPWTITDKDGNYQIVGKREHPNGWVDDPDHTINFPPGTTLDEVIDRMIAIVQEAGRLQRTGADVPRV